MRTCVSLSACSARWRRSSAVASAARAQSFAVCSAAARRVLVFTGRIPLEGDSSDSGWGTGSPVETEGMTGGEMVWALLVF